MKITLSQLGQIYPVSTKANREKYLPFINQFAEQYEINTLERTCAFLAQVGHESGQLRYVEEIASGRAYEGRKDLGNTFTGDGVKFKGRGLIQITGRANYTSLSKDFGIDFTSNPGLLKEPAYAVRSAFWFWKTKNLNRYATLKESDFQQMTRIINGGLNGYADRYNIWSRAKDVLK